MNPLVSIIVPLYNRAELVKETIQSVLDQTYPHWELLVVDDGSTDGSDAVVKAYAEKDERIKFHYRQREPKGAPTCRNIGLEKSTGEYVIFLDSDDLLAPWCLEERIEHFQENLGSDFITFLSLTFHNSVGDSRFLLNKYSESGDLFLLLSYDFIMNTVSSIWKKESIVKLGLWDETLLSKQDWELYIRAISNGLTYFKINNIPDNFVRLGSGSVGGNTSLRTMMNRFYLLNKVICLLRNKNILSPAYSKLIIALLYESSYGLSVHGAYEEAKRVWELSRRHLKLDWSIFHLYKFYFFFISKSNGSWPFYLKVYHKMLFAVSNYAPSNKVSFLNTELSENEFMSFKKKLIKH